MISIVVPAYNAEKHIARCLESVSAQTYDAFEVIVVDDGSTDATADVVKSWPDDRIRLVQQTNAGVSAARNRGVEEANGAWIAFIDADDRWEPTFLEAVVRASQDFPEAVAVFTNFMDSVTGKPMIPDMTGGTRLLQDYLAFVMENRQGMWSSCSLIHRQTLEDVGGFPVGVTHGEDLDTWLRLAWTGPIAYVPDILAVYHTETEGSAMKVPLQKRLRYPQVVKTFREWQSRGKIPGQLVATSERYTQRYLYSYVGSLLAIGDKRTARGALFRECRISYAPVRYLAYAMASFVPTKIYNQLRTQLRGWFTLP